MHSDLTISHADRRPMYLQIMEQIRHRVAVGDWKPGHELPSIRALAVSTRVSVITVKRAYLELERDGVIVTRQGKGSFVADNVDLSAQLRHEELDEHLRAATEIGKHLGLTTDDLVGRLRDAAEPPEGKEPGTEEVA
ncbi:MAG TPA: GntR family transcriptional regulator [Gammaproteobacteria bacterium]|jgi:GntR family transcriptional regulator|nr:GntR family transcriptional regulator [Gammaproteobacteria bacterium]